MSRSSRSVAALLACALLAGAATSAHASSVQPFTLAQMITTSDEIVVGRVVASEARWQGKLIVTVSSIRVDEAIKGARADFEITQVGGTAVHPRTGFLISMSSSAQVALEPGEEVLLFVARGQSDARLLVGAHQGKFAIRLDEADGVRKLPVGPKRLDTLRGRDRDSLRPVPLSLDLMRARIQALMRAPAQSGQPK